MQNEKYETPFGIYGTTDACRLWCNEQHYNGPMISDHHSKKYREHGKIQTEREKEITP